MGDWCGTGGNAFLGHHTRSCSVAFVLPQARQTRDPPLPPGPVSSSAGHHSLARPQSASSWLSIPPCDTSSEYGTATKHAAAVASTKAKAPVLAGNGRDSDDTTASWISTSPILERLRGKIKRGEYIHLSLLLQGNLAAACESRSESTSECARLLSESASLPIMYFTG